MAQSSYGWSGLDQRRPSRAPVRRPSGAASSVRWSRRRANAIAVDLARNRPLSRPLMPRSVIGPALRSDQRYVQMVSVRPMAGR
jgi:hypothetical protein